MIAEAGSEIWPLLGISRLYFSFLSQANDSRKPGAKDGPYSRNVSQTNAIRIAYLAWYFQSLF